jgi:CTP synthase (UTP-ammonia lyase)
MKTTQTVHIGIVGDFDASRPTHTATSEAIAHAAGVLAVDADARWLSTASLPELPAREIEALAGFVVAPGSPYRSIDGTLRAIMYARENGVPLLGTCGGFQHVVLEFARNVLGLAEAHHAEYEPRGSQLVIEPLACSLSGQRAAVSLEAGSKVASFYGAELVTEEYRCSFGLAAGYESALQQSGLRVSGRDANGEPRVVELAGHPFFVATLFVPQLSSKTVYPHPLLRAFVAACAREQWARSAA